MIDVFLHLPKTGGTSVRTALRWICGWRGVYTTQTNVEDPERIAQKLGNEDRKQLVRGHLTYGLHEHIESKCRYFTLARDPVSRVISLYYYIKRGWPESEAASMSLEEYIQSDHHAYAFNDQVRRLAGPPYSDDPMDSALLERAMDHLDHNIVSGVTERFDQSLVLFYCRLGWSRFPFYVRTKTGRDRPSKDEIDPGVRELIEHQNELDLKMYEYVTQQFDSAVDSTPQFQRKLNRFRYRQNMFSKINAPLMKAYQYVLSVGEGA